ncbi:hypothetical protein [Limnobacter sp. P1]|uniref:hypothetical protein n=1 Tax=Limnobacter olei TaxID=3031298 RepID=UPI0023AF7358|nr:hypothetical protein [Limnobacter sp. P1]
MISIDMTKAREIKRDMIRAERAPMLATLDVQFMRAVETGDTAAQQAIAAQKQRLRDATQDPRIDTAQTPDELKDLNPLSV